MKYSEHHLRRKIRRVILEYLDDNAWAAHADALDKKQKDEKSEKASKDKLKKHMKKKSDLKKEVVERLNDYSEDILKSINISIKKGSLSPLLIKKVDDSKHKYYNVIKISPKIKLKGKKLQNYYKVIIRLGIIEIEVSSDKNKMKEEENRGKNVSAISDLVMFLEKAEFNTPTNSAKPDLENDYDDYIKSLPSNLKNSFKRKGIKLRKSKK